MARTGHPGESAVRGVLTRCLVLVLLLTQLLTLPLLAQDTDTESWFSLSSQKTFLPGEKPEIAVNAHNVKELEFRVYRVNDPVKFFSQMQELHNFGGQGPAMPKQAHTWLEKFHAWKHRIWAWIRDFIRAQFSPETRATRFACGRWAKSEEAQGPEGRRLRAGPGAEPAAGGLGVEVDGAGA